MMCWSPGGEIGRRGGLKIPSERVRVRIPPRAPFRCGKKPTEDLSPGDRIDESILTDYHEMEVGVAAAALAFSLEDGDIRELDRRLCALGRGDAGLRLRIGELGQELAQRGLFRELGFSRFSFYALQRCQRGVGWMRESRRVARAARDLPRLRSALRRGQLSWSMAELCVRHASFENEVEIVERAKQSTVRQMRKWFVEMEDSGGKDRDDRGFRPDSRAERCERDDVGCVAESDADSSAHVGMDGPGHTRKDSGRRPAGVSSAETQRFRRMPPDAVGRGRGWRPGEAVLDLSEVTAECERLRRRTRRRRVPYEEFVAFEATRELASQVAGSKATDVIVDALLAETETALMNCGGSGFMEIEAELEARDESWRVWMEQRAAYDDEAEASCEEQIPVAEPADVVLVEDPLPSTATGLDAEIVQRCAALARRALEMGELALRLCEAGGWRELGFASLKQYARERTGCSLSSLEHKMVLARRVREFPELGQALVETRPSQADTAPSKTTDRRHEVESEGPVRIGFEVAMRLGRVADSTTIEAWIDRARRRTVKHLDEEIRSAQMIARNSGSTTVKPPSDEELRAVFEIQRTIASGELLDPTPADWRQHETQQASPPEIQRFTTAKEPADEPSLQCGTRVGAPDAPTSFGEGVELGVGTAIAEGLVLEDGDASGEKCRPLLSDDPPTAWKRVFRGCGMHTLRLNLSEDLWARWTALEKIHRRIRPLDESFLMFMMTAAWSSWAPGLPRPFKFKHIHDRDRWICTSPVCWSRVVTDHHLTPRSRGGTDVDENNTSPCFVCHLDGVHGSGWLKVEPPASNMRWTIGRLPTMLVMGREVVHYGWAAAPSC